MSLTNNTSIVITNDKDEIISINNYAMILFNESLQNIKGAKISDFLNEEEGFIRVEDDENKHILFDKTYTFINNEEHTLYFIQEYSEKIEEDPIVRSLTDSSFDAILIIEATPHKRVVFVSPEIKKFQIRKVDIMNKNFLSLIKGKEILKTRTIFDKCKETRRKIKSEILLNNIEINTSNNENEAFSKEIFAEANITPIISSENEVTHFCVTLRHLDISSEHYKNLKTNEQLLNSLFSSNPDMIFNLNETFLLKTINKSLTDKTGFDEDELLGKPFATLFDIKHFKTISKMLLDIKDTNKGSKPLIDSGEIELPEESIVEGFNLHEDEFIMTKKDGTPLPVKLTLFPIHFNGKVTGIYGVAKDILHSKETEQQIREVANKDALTNVPNRRSFEHKLKSFKFKNENDTNYDKFSLAFFDLDGFKGVNDKYGHDVGDKLLVEVAKRVSEITDEEDCYFSRISGDEFTIIINDNKDTNELERIVKRVINAFSTDFPIDESLDILVTCSVGVSRHPEDTDNYEDLIRFADLAMYESKKKGKNTFTIFEQDILEDGDETTITKESILQGIKNDEFKLFFQPIVNFLDYEDIPATEALIRWEHPEKGLITPGDFITLAESTNIIHNLGYWVIEEACLQQKKWEKEGKDLFPISVNVSGRQLTEEDFVENVIEIFDKTKTDPKLIILEITESVSIENSNDIRKMLRKLRETGCKIAIDDFGTGYSSLTYLKDFPADYLKIDKSFTTNIENNDRLKGIVETIVSLGHKLGLVVIAEGVETKDEAIPLTRSGVDYIQGFLFSKPLNAEDFSDSFHNIFNKK